VLLADGEGRLHWERSENVRVVSIDRRAPGAWLDPGDEASPSSPKGG
jgi:hypothetical protein